MAPRGRGRPSIPSQSSPKARANASPAWHFMVKDERSNGRYASCKLCEAKRARQILEEPDTPYNKLYGVFSRGTSTNSGDWGTKTLLNHLRSSHPKEFNAHQDEISKKKERETLKKYLFDKTPQASSPASIIHTKLGSKKKQATIKATINGTQKWAKNDPLTIACAQAIAEYITLASLSTRHIDSYAFRSMISKLKPYYPHISSTVFARKTLPSLAIDLKKTVQEVVDRADFISFTTDMWTSKYSQDSFIAFTGHMIALDKTATETLLLGCKYFPEAHTSKNITEAIEELIREYKIPRHKIGAVVSDNAHNVVRGVRDTGLNGFGCLLHRMHIVIKDSLKEMDGGGLGTVITKCRKIVQLVHKSGVAKRSLNLHQERLQKDTRRLKQEICTR